PIAIVVAETIEAAEEAANLVTAHYETGPAAMFSSASDVVPRTQGNGYAFAELDAAKGDFEACWAAATEKIDATYSTASRHHNPMEPSATLAEWRGDELYMHDATQWTYGIRIAMSTALGIEPAKVHVRCPHTGGGFGCKGYVWPHQVLAALAA